MNLRASLKSFLPGSMSCSADKKNTRREAAVSFLALAVLYIPVFKDLFYAWNIKPEASHGYLILPIALFLIWQKREKLARYQPKGEAPGLFLLFSGIVLYLVGEATRISTLSNASFMISLVGVLWATLGRQYMRELAFPIFFLVFMLPVPDAIYISLTAPLKLFVSSISCSILQGMGVAVIQEGNIFTFANITLEVVEACSGLRSLLSYLVLGTLLAYFLPPQTPVKKVLLIAMTLPISLFINVMRIVATGVLSNIFGRAAAEGFFHETSGIILFFIGVCILCGLFFSMHKKMEGENITQKSIVNEK